MWFFQSALKCEKRRGDFSHDFAVENEDHSDFIKLRNLLLRYKTLLGLTPNISFLSASSIIFEYEYQSYTQEYIYVYID